METRLSEAFGRSFKNIHELISDYTEHPPQITSLEEMNNFIATFH